MSKKVTIRLAGLEPDAATAVFKALKGNHPILPGGRRMTEIRWVPQRGDAIELELEFADPKLSIPELIAKWHADPTAENRIALRLALAEHRNAFIQDNTAYFAGYRNGIPIIEIY